MAKDKFFEYSDALKDSLRIMKLILIKNQSLHEKYNIGNIFFFHH